MDFRPSPEEIAFRAEVVEFLATSLPDHLRMHQDGAQLSTREETLGWQRILYKKGWGAPHWPKELGGTGWTPQQRLIFELECTAAGTPWPNHQGINLLAPVVNHFGTPQQKERFALPALRGEMYWAQGFSEPNAGSDLAALQTAAKRVGDRYIINGQKIWTSHAMHADYIFMLVRTEKAPKKQQGISFIVCPIKAKGITVRPIHSIDGLQHLTEVFFDDVEVPVENLIGEEGQGWSITKHALGIERLFGACDIGGMKRELARLKKAIARPSGPRGAWIDDPLMAARLARIDMEAETITMAFLKAISTTSDDMQVPSIIKVKVTELHQQIVEFMYEVCGDRGPLFIPDPFGRDTALLFDGLDPDYSKVSSEVMYRRASSIYGGTNEIQRDIIAKLALGA
jgi:acyl-CoA dehydrogenase